MSTHHVGALYHDTLDGNVQVQAQRKTPIKLADAPQIAICVPVGAKHTTGAMECNKEYGGCGMMWQQIEGVRMPNLMPMHFMLSHMNLQQPLNCGLTYFFESGRLSAPARQIMTKNALRAGVKYILYWDDDTLPPPLGLFTLHNWMERHPEAGAISGVYTTRTEPNEPLIYTEQGNGAAWDFEMGPGAQPEPIMGAGAGFLLARAEAVADVIEKMKAENGGEEVPIWADEQIAKGQDGAPRAHFWGHDVRFCKLLNEWGWPVYVHGEVLCGHLDIATGKIFEVPKDAPGFEKTRKRNINTKAYWDDVYGKEGANTWRTYPEMFDKVAAEVQPGSRVVELGCGVGVLGSKLTAQKAVDYQGYDISAQAIAYARARFLDVAEVDVAKIDGCMFDHAHAVIATELMEHLDEDVFHRVVSTIHESPVRKFVFTVPDNCMGPDEVPEHTALFNEELVRERMAGYEGWSLRIDKADAHHLICVMER